jgi:hypothetical protein
MRLRGEKRKEKKRSEKKNISLIIHYHKITLTFLLQNKRCSFIQIDRVHRCNRLMEYCISKKNVSKWLFMGLNRLIIYLHLCHFWLSMVASSVLIGFSSVESLNPSDYLIQFIYSACGRWARRSFLQLIWLVCVWIVWNERNHLLFRNSAKSLIQLLDKVKLYSFWWLKAKNINLLVNLHSWWSSPLFCLISTNFVTYCIHLIVHFVNSRSLSRYTLCWDDYLVFVIYIYSIFVC